MIIKVKTGYRGVSTKERYIAEGEYNSNDPLLYGQAQFLIDSGRAIVLQPDEPETPQPPKKAK